MIEVVLRFEEQGAVKKCGLKFIDCLAQIVESGETGHGLTNDYLGGLIGGGYTIERRGYSFYLSPLEILTAVDEAIDEVEFPADYSI